jgi:hypothetical protein
VHRQHHLRAGGELDLGHAEEGAPCAVHDEVGERIVEQRRAIVAQRDAPARRLLVEAVAQQRQQRLRAEIAPATRLLAPATRRVEAKITGCIGGASSL